MTDGKQPTLSELIQRARKSDLEAQSLLMSLTQSKLFKFCILLGEKRELAEDLCQEVYLKAFKNIDQLKKPEAFQSWLYQIAKNMFIDMNRAQKELLLSKPETDSNPEITSSNLDLILDVQRVLAQFEISERFLLLLVELEGFSYLEAAELVGTTESAVRSKLHRLRKEFINKLNNSKRLII